MPNLNDLQDTSPDQDQDSNQQLALTGDDLAALHSVARRLQAAGDPRVGKLWAVIEHQSGGGDGTPPPKFTLTQSPLKVTSWLEDLENDLWGDQSQTDDPATNQSNSSSEPGSNGTTPVPIEGSISSLGSNSSSRGTAFLASQLHPNSEPEGTDSVGAAQIPFIRQEDVPPLAPPAPPGVPSFAFDKARINKLTVEQVAGIVFNENRDVQSGESTPEELQQAKTAQAHALINGDRKFGYGRPKTADWKVSTDLKKTAQYEQALEAARTAFQDDNLGTDPTGGRVYFNNRFEGDKTGPRVYRGAPQDPYHTYGPFLVHGGKVWTVVYDDFRKK